jgi:hypothetical protein
MHSSNKLKFGDKFTTQAQHANDKEKERKMARLRKGRRGRAIVATNEILMRRGEKLPHLYPALLNRRLQFC